VRNAWQPSFDITSEVGQGAHLSKEKDVSGASNKRKLAYGDIESPVKNKDEFAWSDVLQNYADFEN